MFITAFTSPIPVSSSPSFWLDVCAKPRITSSRPKFTRPIRRARMIVLDDMGTKSESSSNQPVPIPTPHDLATGRDPARIKIFDTTLRDGEQSPGVSLTTDEKLVIARQLSKLGVDIIEAGFPIASDGDFEAVKSIAINIGNSEDPPIICGLARALKKDIIRCYDAIKYAAFPRIHTFVATSELHMVHKLRKSREEVLHIITDTVAYASSLCDDIEFSAEDAARSDPDFLCEAFSRAIEAGATTINIPDTVGYTTPQEFGTLVQYVRNNVRGIEKATVSVHGHNDLGMAVANFFSALENGARQLEVTINGIGERAGNASLEEIVMGLHVRRPYYNRFLGRDEQSDICLTNICRSEIHQTSRMVSNMTGMVVQPNKAIVGANAFSHESGIHQDGVLKHRQTYEIMDAQSIGLSKNSIVLGKHSGRHAFRTHLKDIGYELSGEEVDRAFRRFKSLADKKKEVSDADIESLVNDEMRLVEEMVKLGRVQVQCGDHCIPTATVTLVHVEENREETMSSVGTGPVDAVFNAIQKVTGSMVDMTLKEYKVSSVTKGIDALGEVSVKVVDGCTGKDYIGASANTDVVVASAQAYVNVINRCHMNKTAPPKVHPQFGSI